MRAAQPSRSDAAATGLAHVATVSFLAARAAPSGQFAIALAGGVALARAAARAGLRAGYGASAAAMLQTVALMGPARVNGPLTQAMSAPLLGGLYARGARPVTQFLAALAIRLAHYTLLSALFIWVVLGGLDAYAGSFDAIAGRLGFVPRGVAAALVFTALTNLAWALVLSAVQVLVYRRALGAWPAEVTPGHPAPAARPAAGAGDARFDPRALTLAAALATALLLASTAWPLLGAVAAWLVLAWVATRADARALPLGGALAALLAVSALTGSLLAGLGLAEALRRATRALLLVAVATWLRAAARPSGLREVFRRALRRARRVPAAREAGALLDGLDSSTGRLLAAGRSLAAGVAGVPKRPAPLADAVIAWVASEAAGYRARPRSAPWTAIAVRGRDAVLVGLAAAPALALLGG